MGKYLPPGYWSGASDPSRPRSSRRLPCSRHAPRRTRCGVRPETNLGLNPSPGHQSGGSGRNRSLSSRKHHRSGRGSRRTRCGVRPATTLGHRPPSGYRSGVPVGAVRVHHVNIIVSVTARVERDAVSVRRPTWGEFQCRVIGQAGLAGAVRVHHVDIIVFAPA